MSQALDLEKLLNRLGSVRQQRKYYELLQIYKTIYFRCIKAKKYDLAVKYLYEGIELLISNDNQNDAFDLLKLVQKMLNSDQISLSIFLSRLKKILAMLPLNSNVRATFQANILQKISDSPDKEQMLSDFHTFLGKTLWKESSMGQARYHIMKSGDGFLIGSFLVEYHTKHGFKSEVDMFICQAVLQCLCTQKHLVACTAYCTYVHCHPQMRESSTNRLLGPPFDDFPALNFIWILLCAIEKHCSLTMFRFLCEIYSHCLSRDNLYAAYLQKIAILYFGMVAPPSSNQDAGQQLGSGGGDGFFDNLMQMFGSDDISDNRTNRHHESLEGRQMSVDQMD